MKLRFKNTETKDIGVTFVTDEDAAVLEAVGYYHCEDEDFSDNENNGDFVEIWKPKGIKKEDNSKGENK